MSQKQFSTIVYIGRFQPFHNGHLETIKRAQSLADQVIVLIGSAFKPRTIKDPFTYDERRKLIESVFPSRWDDKSLSEWVKVFPLVDNLYNDEAWASQVQDTVGLNTVWHKPENKTGIIGFEKDESSFYLKMFPQWESVPMANISGIDASKIRETYFKDLYATPSVIPTQTRDFLNVFSTTLDFVQLCNEYSFIESYKKSWSTAPYPPTFVTVDAVVFYCGHVLLVKRKAEPGKGLWALPGGFIGAKEKIKDACVRELYEETKLGLYPSELHSMYKSSDVFDAPGRSLRGRTITHAFHFSTILPFTRLEGKLPKVKGSDDAEVARWFPLNQALSMGDQLFEDHRDVILKFV